MLPKIAQTSRDRLGFKALTGGQTPNFRTVKRFRPRHLAADCSTRCWNVVWKLVLSLSSMLRSTALGLRRMRRSAKQGDELWTDGQGGAGTGFGNRGAAGLRGSSWLLEAVLRRPEARDVAEMPRVGFPRLHRCDSGKTKDSAGANSHQDGIGKIGGLLGRLRARKSDMDPTRASPCRAAAILNAPHQQA